MKTRNPFHLVAGWMLWCVILGVCLTACSTRQPWRAGDKILGTMTVRRHAQGFAYDYFDLRGRLVRVEERDAAKQLRAGHSVTQYEYDPEGLRSLERFCNASGGLVLNENGVAVLRHRRAMDGKGNRVLEALSFGIADEPVLNRAGCHIQRTVFHGTSPRLARITFHDTADGPAPTTWLDVANVAVVEFTTLEGVGEMTGAACLDVKGAVVARKITAGSAYGSYQSTTTYGSYPAYR